MKKSVSCLLVLLVLLLLPALTIDVRAEEISGTCGENLTWMLDGEGTLTIFGIGEMEDFFGNTETGRPWENYVSEIKAIVITEGVTTIADSAFMGCINATSIMIPESVTYIGRGAFQSCSLTNVELPDGITTIEDKTFSYCEKLVSVSIPDGVTWIGNFAFEKCFSLTNINIPKSVTSIASYAFSECSSLTSVVIPKGCISFGTEVFYKCSSLINVVIPESVTDLGLCTFIGCVNLSSVIIPESITSLGEALFSGCSSLVRINIPESVTSIREAAFAGCTSLRDVYYAGSEEHWAEIRIGEEYNECLLNAKIHYNSTLPNEPVTPPADDNESTTPPAEDNEPTTPPTENDNPVTPPTEPAPIDNPFTDVAEDAYYYDPVLWAVEKGITNGMDATRFVPDGTCTRAQIVTFLWRANGSPAPASGNNPFTDVPAGQWYTDAVLWAVEKGITSGVSADSFAPNEPCTRGQVATFLWRSEGQPTSGGSNIFTDIASGAYYYDAVLWAVENGITNGMGDGLFAPDATCTRGQIVTFLYRALA